MSSNNDLKPCMTISTYYIMGLCEHIPKVSFVTNSVVLQQAINKYSSEVTGYHPNHRLRGRVSTGRPETYDVRTSLKLVH